MPIMPRFSGCDAGNAPMPSSVVVTGMCVRSANCRTTSMAPEIMMPWPARISGRLIERMLDLTRPRTMIRPIAAQLGRVRPDELGGGLLRVLRDVDEHGARSAR